MSEQPPATDPSTIYPIHCPPWCDGRHPAMLCADPDTELNADAFISHGRILATSTNGALSVELLHEEAHPETDCEPEGTHLAVYLDDADCTTPETLHDYARTLTAAARIAKEYLP